MFKEFAARTKKVYDARHSLGRFPGVEVTVTPNFDDFCGYSDLILFMNGITFYRDQPTAKDKTDFCHKFGFKEKILADCLVKLTTSVRIIFYKF